MAYAGFSITLGNRQGLIGLSSVARVSGPTGPDAVSVPSAAWTSGPDIALVRASGCTPGVPLLSDPLIVGTSPILVVRYPPLLPRLPAM